MSGRQDLTAIHDTKESRSPSQIAIVCAGLDSKLRGYETHQRTLFDSLLADGHSVALFKRDGISIENQEIPLRTPSTRSRIVKLISKFYDSPLQTHHAIFASAFVIYCLFHRKKYSHVLVIEPGVARVIHRLRNLLPRRSKIVYTHGIGDHPQYYFRFSDEIIEVNLANYDAALDYRAKRGGPPIHLIPHFLRSPPSPTSNEVRGSAREKLGIRTPHVALYVGVVSKIPKRVDLLIDEISLAPDSWTLLLIGEVADQGVLAHGKELLSGRVLHTVLPRDRVHIAYQASDVFVFASENEGFGIVLLEAMSFGLPIIAADREPFRWILGPEGKLFDPNTRGSLASILKHEGESLGWRARHGRYGLDLIEQRYTWNKVRRNYRELLSG